MLCDLVPFVQFKKRKKYSWRSVQFSKVAGSKPATLLKLTLLHVCFSWFANCTNTTKSRNVSQITHCSTWCYANPFCLFQDVLSCTNLCDLITAFRKGSSNLHFCSEVSPWTLRWTSPWTSSVTLNFFNISLD